MITKKVEVSVEPTICELIEEVRLRDPLGTMWIIKALFDSTKDEELVALRDFLGAGTFHEYIGLVDAYLQRLRRIEV